MTVYPRTVEKRRVVQDFCRHEEEEVVGSLCRLSNRPVSPKTQMEQEKRIRREIANSNERRRMQSINAGFQSLRTLLPHHDGEKLSKAAILQQTADYIYQMEQEKTRLLTQNCQLKRLLNQQNHDSDGGSSIDSPLPKRKKTEPVEPVDEGIGSMSPPGIEEPRTEELKREMIELRIQLDRERRLRMILEEQTRNLEAQLYPERIREIAQQVQLQYHPDGTVEKLESGHTSLEDEEHDSLPLPETKTDMRIPPITNMPSDPEVPCSNNLVEKDETPSSSQLYVASTSRQNLETIVEAIRHLEGDHLFRDDPSPSLVIREAKTDDSHVYSKAHVSAPSTSVVAVTSTTISPPESHYRRVIQVPPTRPGVIVSTHS